jgi:long-subunit fatty acid transport protein
MFLVFLFCLSFPVNAQVATTSTDSFGSRVRYGGGLSLSFGNDAFLIGVSPQAIYQVNDFLAIGAGLSYTYSKVGETKINAVGGSLLALANPIAALQLSAEFEELYIDRDALFFSDNYWVPALYLGVGYGIGPVTVGIRYDVLHDDSKSLYSDPWLPFVRVYF